MTILATLEPIETLDTVTDAIRAHLKSPGIPVTKICKDHGVSRATFYRRLKAASGNLSSEAATPVRPLAHVAPKATQTGFKACTEGCGFIIDLSWSDERILSHWLNDCPTASSDLKSSCWHNLDRLEKERRKAQWKIRVTSLSVHSGTSETVAPKTDTTNTGERISVESSAPLNESSPDAETPENDSDDPFYQAKFDGSGDVRPDWSYLDWTLNRLTGIRSFPSRECVTVTHPRRTR